MSAFTDWNGPGCGGGNTLPQVVTLEQLLVRINELRGYLDHVRHDLTDHVAETAITSAVHQVNQFVTGIKNQLESLLAAEITARQQGDSNNASLINTEHVRIDSLDGRMANQENVTNPALSAATVQARLDAIAHANTIVQALITSLHSVVETKEIKAFSQTFILVDDLLRCVSGVLGPLYPHGIIDYKNFAYTQCPAASVFNDTQNKYDPKNAVAILGILSPDWDGAGVDPGHIATLLGDANEHAIGDVFKPARAYIKFIDDKPWNAIIDMAFSQQNNAVDINFKYTGVLKGMIAKTKDRDYVVFGLYYAKGVDGKQYVYLGVKSEDIQHVYFQGNSTYQIIAGLSVFIAGVNFLPMEKKYLPNSALRELTTSVFLTAGDESYDKIIVQQIYSDEYRDEEGHGVAITDEAKDTLTIGNNPNDPDPDAQGVPPHQLEIYSRDRPNITLADNRKYSMAFLEDLVTSVYWQRSVNVIVDFKADLTNPLKTSVWVDGNGNIVGRNSPAAVTQVPGIYYVDPANEDSTISGHVFEAGDIALVKGINNNTIIDPDAPVTGDLADGFFNSVFPSGGSITNQDYTLITGTSENPGIGTFLVDQAGVYARIDVINTVTNTFDGTIVAPPLFTYTKPVYYMFSGTAWAYNQDVEIPFKTISGYPEEYVWDITYEWSGPTSHMSRISTDGEYFEDAYIIWTAAHENVHTYPDYASNPWSTQEIHMAGYRSALRQDEIDRSLEALATMSPDYAEQQQVIDTVLPEGIVQATPNPVYIHHKPWVGTSIFDGGAFNSGVFFANWYVDGGDFSSLIAPPNPLVPPATSGEQYRNAIMRLWHGNLTDMPEYTFSGDTQFNALPVNVPDAIWENFSRTLRWLDDEECLIFSMASMTGSGKLYKFMPISDFDSETLTFANYDHSTNTVLEFTQDPDTQVITVSSPMMEKVRDLLDQMPDAVRELEIQAGVTPANTFEVIKTMVNINQMQPSVTSYLSSFIASNNTLSFAWDPATLIMTVDSPRMDIIEQKIDVPMVREIEITTASVSSITFQKQLRNLWTGVVDTYNIVLENTDGLLDFGWNAATLELSLNFNAAWVANYNTLVADVADLMTDMTQAQADITQAQTDITNLTTDLGQAQTDISQAQTDITNLTTTLGQAQTAIATAQADITSLTLTMGQVKVDISALQTSPAQNDPTTVGTLAYALANPPTTAGQYSLQVNTNTVPPTYDWI